jgi:hypothetical protein
LKHHEPIGRSHHLVVAHKAINVCNEQAWLLRKHATHAHIHGNAGTETRPSVRVERCDGIRALGEWITGKLEMGTLRGLAR